MRKLLALMIVVALCAAATPARAQDVPFGSVYIPRINLVARVSECPIVNGWHDTTQLGAGVCHLEGTATIDHDWARIVLAGHTPGAFDDLRLLRTGDQVVVWNTHAVEVYRVVLMMITTIDDIRWLMPTEDETLTLITCDQARRLIVHAEKEN